MSSCTFSLVSLLVPDSWPKYLQSSTAVAPKLLGPALLRPVSSNFVFSSGTKMESFLIHLTLQTPGL